MARCELTGKGPVVKNLVSHSNIKTKSRAFSNIQSKRIFSNSLNQLLRFRVAVSAIRDMEASGGLDSFLLRQPDEQLSKRALTVKNKLRRKLNIQK